MSTAILLAPASREFSISSLTTDAGRSTTSPAAMRLAMSSGRMRIFISRSAADYANNADINLRNWRNPRLVLSYLDSDFFQLLIRDRRRRATHHVDGAGRLRKRDDVTN